MAPKEQELRPVMTRLPEKLRARLERAALKAKRSMNAEIIHRLQESFRADEDLSERIKELGIRVDKLERIPGFPRHLAEKITKGDKS